MPSSMLPIMTVPASPYGTLGSSRAMEEGCVDASKNLSGPGCSRLRFIAGGLTGLAAITLLVTQLTSPGGGIPAFSDSSESASPDRPACPLGDITALQVLNYGLLMFFFGVWVTSHA